jgi:hypothetical protein
LQTPLGAQNAKKSNKNETENRIKGVFHQGTILNSITEILLLQGPPDKVEPAGNQTGKLVVMK